MSRFFPISERHKVCQARGCLFGKDALRTATNAFSLGDILRFLLLGRLFSVLPFFFAFLDTNSSDALFFPCLPGLFWEAFLVFALLLLL